MQARPARPGPAAFVPANTAAECTAGGRGRTRTVIYPPRTELIREALSLLSLTGTGSRWACWGPCWPAAAHPAPSRTPTCRRRRPAPCRRAARMGPEGYRTFPAAGCAEGQQGLSSGGCTAGAPRAGCAWLARVLRRVAFVPNLPLNSSHCHSDPRASRGRVQMRMPSRVTLVRRVRISCCTSRISCCTSRKHHHSI
jgi:hypothetical protein